MLLLNRGRHKAYSIQTGLSNNCVLAASVLSCSVVSDSLWPHGLQPAKLLSMDFPGKNTGVDCHALLQRIFPTQRLNLSLLHCKWILYHLSYRKDPYSLLKIYFNQTMSYILCIYYFIFIMIYYLISISLQNNKNSTSERF